MRSLVYINRKRKSPVQNLMRHLGKHSRIPRRGLERRKYG